MRDIDSFLGKLEMWVERYFSHYTTFSCTEDDGEPACFLEKIRL
jgi:hypothetical protein